MLTLTIPQSDPSAARKRSASAWSAVKMLDERPCGHVVVERDRLVEVGVGQDVEERGERLLPRPRRSGRRSARSRARRRTPPAPRRPERAPPPATTLPPSPRGLLECAPASPRRRRAWISGPDQGPRRQRVADGQPLVGRGQASVSSSTTLGVGDHPAHRRAALTGRAGRGEDDAADGEVEVGATG